MMTACDPMEDINKELEEMPNYYIGKETLTLSSADYDQIAALAVKGGVSKLDSTKAAFIAAHEHFNDTVSAATYIPGLLAQKYPRFNYTSSALVTYNYNGEMPEEFEKYTEALSYALIDEDYSSSDSIVDLLKYYTPTYSPLVYIPQVLDKVVAAPEDGDLILVNYDYSTVHPDIDFSKVGDSPVFEQTFEEESAGLNGYTAFSVSGDQVWEWASYGGGCLKMTGYVNPTRYVNEDWLVSDEYDLTEISEPALYFTHALNFNSGEWGNIAVFVSTDYDGSSSPAAQGTWVELTIPGVPFTESWTFISSGRIDLQAYAGEKIYVAFRYLSSAVTAGTWEINNIQISAPGVPVSGPAPQSYKEFYTYSSTEGWAKSTDVYCVTNADYKAMGSPGKYNNFSATDKPDAYLPNLLYDKFPLAGEGSEMAVVYNYYNAANKATTALADNYTFKSGQWVSTYNFVEPKTDQFLVASTGNWVFDPTINHTMVSADFQLIVDWVKENKGAGYIDDFGTAEFYTGASAYRKNFDIRNGKFESADFATWEKAVEFAIGTVLLPARYPDITEQEAGIDQHVIVTFATYSGIAGTYKMKFQVTKSGPDPEFTLVEGPY